MKALFLSDDLSLFNEQSPARIRLRSYAEAIGELHVLSRAPHAAKRTDDGPLHLHPLTGGKFATFLTLPDAARRIIRTHDIEVVSAQDPFERGLMALLAVQGTSAKLHIQAHVDFLSPYFARESLLNRVRLLIAQFVLPKAAAVRVVSRRVADTLRARYGIEASVLPIVPPPEDVVPVPLPRAFPFTLITAARLEKEKRIEDIITALLKSGREDAGLLIVGEGSEKSRLEAVAARLGITQRVVFTGWRTDLPGLLKSAHAYIQASTYEGYGRSLIEAALAGLPLIATDAGIVGEVFTDESVLVAPVGDVAALAQHIRTLAEDPERRAALATGAVIAATGHIGQFSSQPAMIRDDLSRALSS